MKVLVIYDSVYGNTEQIAKAISGAITGEVKLLRASELKTSELESIDLLFAGSPTQGGRPLQSLQDLFKRLPEPSLKGVKVAAFDTRFASKWANIFGYAAERIAKELKKKGSKLVAPSEGFFVKGTKGPLKENELKRAADWAEEIVKGIN